MAKKRKRQLSEPEKQLWERVARSVTPLLKPEQLRVRAKRVDPHATPHSHPLAKPRTPPPVPAFPTHPPSRQLADRATLEQLLNGSSFSAHPTPSSAHRSPPNQHPGHERHIEPRLRKRITRGREEISQTIDLHGLRQDEARHILINFLNHAQSAGTRTVLVITGKGKSAKRAFAALGDPVGDGILRRMVPQWLHQMPHLISGISEADRHHGGGGALYVRLKRKNNGQRRP